MNSKLIVCVVIVVVSQNLSVESSDLKIVPTLGHTITDKAIATESIFTAITNQRIASRIPHETNKYTTTTNCGGTLTRAPGEIKQHLKLGESPNVQCTWTIHPPAGQSIYIRSLKTSMDLRPGKSFEDLDDSLDLRVYEGYSNEPLFNFKNDSSLDSSLDNCITNDSTLRIVLDYVESELYTELDISIKYGFAEESELSDLLD